MCAMELSGCFMMSMWEFWEQMKASDSLKKYEKMSFFSWACSTKVMVGNLSAFFRVV